MRGKLILINLFIVVFCNYKSYALYKSDSLLRVLDTAKSPKVIVKTMCDLWYYHYERNDLNTALSWLQKARRYSIGVNDSSLIFSTTANTGIHYYWCQNYGAALYHYKLSRNYIKRGKNYYKRLISIHLTITDLFKIVKQNDRVKNELDIAEKYLKFVNDSETLFEFNLKKAEYFESLMQIDSALKYYDIAINNYSDEFQYVLQAKYARSKMLNTYSSINENWGKENKSKLEFYFNEYKVFYYRNYSKVAVPGHNSFYLLSAYYYMYFNKTDSVKSCYNKIVELNKDTVTPDFVLPILQLTLKIAIMDKDMGRIKELNEKITSIHDSILMSVQTSNLKSTESFFESEELANVEKLNAQKAELTALESRQKNKTILIFSGVVFIILTSGIILLRNRYKLEQKQKGIIEIKNKETEEQKILIEQKHKEITDSINYAERIQKSFLATKEHLSQNLNDYFVLFKPKDIVSGDFYWSATLNNGSFALATADSTGHGVPGAIMSLLNITSLEKAIETETQPDEILNITRNIIIERLKKDGSIDGGKDGMDCSLCVYDFKNMKLHVAAANNPVWVARSSLRGVQIEIGTTKQSALTGDKIASLPTAARNDAKIIEIKPDKMPVGKHDKQNTLYKQHVIDLQKGDVVYTLTDGFPDQFGGPAGKKFMSKKLRELLKDIVHLPMKEQKQILEKTFNDWAGDLEQVDDVTIVGIKI